MAEAEKRKGGGAKTVRSEIVTVRLDQRLRYLAEIAAKVQRRTLSSYIESTVESSLSGVMLDPEHGVSVGAAAGNLWFISESARLARLNQMYPHLLGIVEQRLVRAAREASQILGAHLRTPGKDERERAEHEADALRPYWDYLKEAAEEDLPMDQILAEVLAIKENLNGTGPLTAERIDKRIDALQSDIKKLQAMKEELKNPKSPEPAVKVTPALRFPMPPK